MNRSENTGSSYGGREALLAVGVAHALFGLGYPLVSGAEEAVGVDTVMVVLVTIPGLVVLATGYRLPRTDVHPDLYPVVTRWTLGGIGAMLALIGFVEVVSTVRNLVENVLILTAIGSVAGLAAGTFAAHAKSRARVLEERNEELRETQADLEETVDQLAESERRYRTLAENFPNGGVALIDRELRHTLVAGKGFDRIEMDASELQGERVPDVSSGDVQDTLESNYRASLAGEARTFEVTFDERTFEFRSHPLTDDGGEVDGILVMTQDVTERKQREEALARRAAQQEVVADLGQYAHETEDIEDLAAEACRQVADVLDVDYCKVLDLDEERDRLVLRQGVGWDDGLVGDASVSALEDDSQAAYTLKNDRPIVVEDMEDEERFSGPDLLRDHEVRSGISVVVGPFDDPWGILGTHDTDRMAFSDDDVSFVQSVANVLAEAIERQEYQRDLELLVERLEESNTRLEQFAYAASHDLQEPLRMVSSYLQLIESRYDDDLDEEGREFIAFAVDGADRMRNMIDGLLEYSRVETEADPLEPVDLECILEDVCEDLRVAIESSDAEIVVESLPRVRGDPNQLRQVFQNLLDNAIEYSGDEPPEVRVSAEHDGGDWVVSVRDQGIGIDPDDQERVFEVFERAHRREESDGTGIGLALCDRIVDRHGGEMRVDSEPGEGATFSFDLPAADEPVR